MFFDFDFGQFICETHMVAHTWFLPLCFYKQLGWLIFLQNHMHVAQYKG